MDITVRRLTAGDEAIAHEVARLLNGADMPPNHAAAFMADDANYLVVAEVAGEIVGVVLAYRLDRVDHPSGQLFVYEVEVTESHRRRGVPRQHSRDRLVFEHGSHRRGQRGSAVRLPGVFLGCRKVTDGAHPQR